MAMDRSVARCLNEYHYSGCMCNREKEMKKRNTIESYRGHHGLSFDSGLKKVVVYYSIANGGDGSAYPEWFITSKAANEYQDRMIEGWSEPCTGSVETFDGSNIHKEALKTEVEFWAQVNAGEDIY